MKSETGRSWRLLGEAGEGLALSCDESMGGRESGTREELPGVDAPVSDFILGRQIPRADAWMKSASSRTSA